jgi:hypothetical protein
MKCNVANCKGADHLGLCWICPHSEDVQRGAYSQQPWETTPCFRCNKKAAEAECDSREQGHGRVISYEEAPPLLVASMPHGDDESDSYRDMIIKAAAYILRRLMRLAPREYVTLIESMRYCVEDDRATERNLNHVKRLTNELFHENVSFQVVGVRLKAAQRKLKD